MKATYQKGTICYRCGILKKDARGVGCFRADRHIWNTKKLTVDVQTFRVVEHR